MRFRIRGAKSTGTLKVAMLGASAWNRERVSEYIERMEISPWEIRMFESEEEAAEWFEG